MSLEAALNLGTAPTIPKGHGTYSYYNPTYAMRVRNLLDEMANNPSQNVFVKSDYLKMQPATIVQWYKQGLGYLITYHDPDKKYAKQATKIAARKQKDGVIFVWLHLTGWDPAFVRNSVVRVSKDVSELYAWRERLQEFIETAVPGQELSLAVHITPDEIQAVKDTLAGADHLSFEVDTNLIKVTYNRPAEFTP